MNLLIFFSNITLFFLGLVLTKKKTSKFIIILYITVNWYNTKLILLLTRDCSDINVDDLFLKLTFLKCSLTKETKYAIDVVHYLKKSDGYFFNAHITYKILFIISFTSAKATPNFLKIKFIKLFCDQPFQQSYMKN